MGSKMTARVALVVSLAILGGLFAMWSAYGQTAPVGVAASTTPTASTSATSTVKSSASPTASATGGGATCAPVVGSPLCLPGGGGSPTPSKSATPTATAKPSATPSKSPKPGGGGKRSVPSTISIAYGNGKFHGGVGSQDAMCKKARDVVVKKVVSGPDRTVGTATTNKRGKWRSPFPKAKGSFYALVKQSVASQHNRQGPETCRGAKSKTIHVGR